MLPGLRQGRRRMSDFAIVFRTFQQRTAAGWIRPGLTVFSTDSPTPLKDPSAPVELPAPGLPCYFYADQDQPASSGKREGEIIFFCRYT